MPVISGFEGSVKDWPAPVLGEIVCHAVLEGEPASKTRARFTVTNSGKARTYNTKAAEASQTAVAWAIKAALSLSEPDAESTFGVRASFASGGLTRRDVDNMLKLVMDAATGVVWKDDWQVTEVHARLARAVETPVTEMLFYRTGTVTKRTTPCLACGAEMRAYRSWKSLRRFCSAACRKTGRTGTEEPCLHCERPMYVAPHLVGRKKYCSGACETAAKTVALVCTYCRRPFTRPQSLARSASPFCTTGCFYAAQRDQQGVEITLTEIA